MGGGGGEGNSRQIRRTRLPTTTLTAIVLNAWSLLHDIISRWTRESRAAVTVSPPPPSTRRQRHTREPDRPCRTCRSAVPSNALSVAYVAHLRRRSTTVSYKYYNRLFPHVSVWDDRPKGIRVMFYFHYSYSVPIHLYLEKLILIFGANELSTINKK